MTYHIKDFNRFKLTLQIIHFITLICIILACSKPLPPEPEEIILAKIGDKTISKNEFIRRAEYTIRPPYCRQNTILDKKIILNSLIAEKLLALEAGNNNPLSRNQLFQAYLKGRKEQAMRQWLYYEEAYHRVEIPDKEIQRTFNVVGRKYQINYFNVPDSALAWKISQKLEADSLAFTSIYQELYGDTLLPQREVEWQSEEDEVIEETLYSHPLKKGQIIGPLPIEANQYLFIQITDWTDQKVIANTDVQKRWEDVKKRLTQKKADGLWNQYIARIMDGKQLEFNSDTFFQVAELLADKYLVSFSNKKEMFDQQFWQKSGTGEHELILNELSQQDKLLNAPFFDLDDEIWTVNDFRTALMSHPLVFRKRRFGRREFPEQLKLAIVDLVADEFLTQEAHKRSIDEINVVKRNASMWEDALLGTFQRNIYLEKIGKTKEFIGNPLSVLENHLNVYVDSLQAKFSDLIEVNMEVFHQIPLTRVDLFVIQKFEPYPILVPAFPVVTSAHRLDYGREMQPGLEY